MPSADVLGYIGWGICAVMGGILVVAAIIHDGKVWLKQLWKRVHVQGNGGHAKVVKDMLGRAELPANSGGRAVIAVGDNETRRKEALRLGKEYKFVSVIDPSAQVSVYARIGEGSVIMAGAVIQAAAKIGKHVIVNTGATIDHDCTVGDFAHIAPGVHLCGNVSVGEGALVGVGSCAVPGARIEAWSLVKAGSVVT